MPTLEEGGRRGVAARQWLKQGESTGDLGWWRGGTVADVQSLVAGRVVAIHSRVLGSRVGGVAVSGVDDAHIGRGRAARAGGVAGEGDRPWQPRSPVRLLTTSARVRRPLVLLRPLDFDLPF